MDIKLIFEEFSRISTMINGLTLHDTRHKAELVKASLEFNNRLQNLTTDLIAKNDKMLSLQDENVSMKEKIRSLDQFDSEAGKYQMKAVGIGIFAYVYKPSTSAGNKPPHWCCQQCFDNKIISVLQCQYPPAYKCNVFMGTIDPRKDGRLVGIEEA